MSKISSEHLDNLLEFLSKELDTRDKRYMFLKMEFPKFIKHIDLEGCAYSTSYNIYDHFDKQGMVGSLIATINCKFDTDLRINY
jgi:hypothetical protein